MKAMPTIQKYMTPMPHTIGNDIPLNTALSMMREHQIRHLPVQHGGKLVGVLTDRDVKLASSLEQAGELTVEDVMTPDPYCVTPETSIDTVSMRMAEHKYGCAIVLQGNGKVVGIFTQIDALRVLTDLLHHSYKPTAASSWEARPL